jgi:hypothetical protein
MMKNYFLILLLTLVNFFLPTYALGAPLPVVYYDAVPGDSYATVIKETTANPLTLKRTL